MPNEREKKVTTIKCAYCGTRVKSDETYCTACGKLLPKSASPGQGTKVTIPEKLEEYTRKCSSCGSLIVSPILRQCPICNEKLEKIPKEIKDAMEKKKQESPGFLFTQKKTTAKPKVVSLKKYTIKRDVWTAREGFRIFAYSLSIQIFVFLAILIIYGVSELNQDNIITIIITQIPAILLGILPIAYIQTNNHEFIKLGFQFSLKKIILAITIGITGGICLVLLDYFTTDFFIHLLYDAGLHLHDIFGELERQNQLIRNAEAFWNVILIIILSLGAFSQEIAYRGVLTNTLKQKFKKSFLYRMVTILLVSLIYSGIYFLLTYPSGLYLFIPTFLYFSILGVLYEINGNILNSIIAAIFYNVSLILIILFI